MTTRVQARHRAAVRARTPLTDLSDSVARTAGGAVRTGAVAAAAGGLLVSVALPASAATSAAPAAVGSTVASVATAVPAAFGTTAAGVVSAPATATTLSTTSTFAAAPAAAPVVVAAPAITRISRTSDTVPVVASSVVVADPAPVVAAPVAEQAPAPAPVQASLGARILDVADDYAGVPYVYGGTTPAGFDCSGYTSYVFRQVGVEIPRTAAAQKSAAATISRGEAVPGDLVFFSNSSGRAYHVGIYAGDGMMWDAPRTGKPVQLRAIWTDAVSFGRLAAV